LAAAAVFAGAFFAAGLVVAARHGAAIRAASAKQKRTAARA